jgi:hypothetical protein
VEAALPTLKLSRTPRYSILNDSIRSSRNLDRGKFTPEGSHAATSYSSSQRVARAYPAPVGASRRAYYSIGRDPVPTEGGSCGIGGGCEEMAHVGCCGGLWQGIKGRFEKLKTGRRTV